MASIKDFTFTMNYVFPTQFNWTRYLTEIFSRVDIHIDEDEDVVVYAPDYLKNVAELLTHTSNRLVCHSLGKFVDLWGKYTALRGLISTVC